jgi:hypothetical protein
MRVGIKVKDDDEIIFDSYDEAMDFVEDLMPRVLELHISTDDISINYYGN